MVDEAKSHKIQLCIGICYVYGHVLEEGILTIADVSLSRTANSLSIIILPFLNNIVINSIMVGQSHDRASLFSGVKIGPEKIIRDSNLFATYVHCLAHKVNLAFLAASKDNDISCNFFNIKQTLYEFFSYLDTHAVQKDLKI